MERDWVPTIASECSEPPLHHLNAVMRRIDLTSKMLAPIFISGVAAQESSAVLAAITVGLNMMTVGIELISARSAWNHCAVLQRERASQPDAAGCEQGGDQEGMGEPEVQKNSLALYFTSDVCLASLSTAIQPFSVLSLSGSMTTYLLSRHYSLSLITFARTVISIIEISSTIIFPIAARFLAKYPLGLIPDPIAALGLSGVSTQVVFTIPCYIALVLVPINMTDPVSTFPLLSASIFLALGFSGFGYWTHNVAVQQIVQTRVPAARRVGFAGVETTFASAAEIGRWASTAIWSRPEQFGGVAAGGLASVVICWLLYAVWIVRLRRKIVLERS
ncbi:Ferroportin-1 [Fusarium oxysporum f. sp. vasinfectum]|uniref:Solute carrier family 40 member n=1 Tax=Fusarium oxysporum f. sp. vasinfectum 25433 TaxID=1089449 RepID=X0KLQ7_FUSOX|nr:hypothetical protein FOTG_17127 [Fusarium oxysporum f. sp. vasinfectum 25433]KAK2667200.1 Ferroportin-1 [Fusarium oxysporum f. sp. vasinfectum]KAK2922759.1 Ferroportin-1 [Fusarium oxysporum f. sp. vasinfectum]